MLIWLSIYGEKIFNGKRVLTTATKQMYNPNSKAIFLFLLKIVNVDSTIIPTTKLDKK
jgi:hypothetical protein